MAINAQQVQSSGIYAARVTLPAILGDLEQIGKLVTEAAASKKRIVGAGCLSLVVAILLVIIGANLKNIFLGACAVFVSILAIALIIYSTKYSAALLKNQDRPMLVAGILKTVQHDSDPRAPFAISLALSGRPKLLREEAWEARKKGKQQFFAEDFLSFEGELLDGTTMKETITELSRKRSYVNPRGKHKSKVRNRYLVTLRLAYPSEVYGDATAASNALQEEIRVPPSATVRSLRVTEKAILAKAMVNLKQDVVPTCAMLGLGAYRILNLARRVAARGTGGAP